MKETAIRMVPVVMIGISLSLGYAIKQMSDANNAVQTGSMTEIAMNETAPTTTLSDAENESLFETLSRPQLNTMQGFAPPVSVPDQITKDQPVQNAVANFDPLNGDVNSSSDAHFSNLTFDTLLENVETDLLVQVNEGVQSSPISSQNEVIPSASSMIDDECMPLMRLDDEPSAMIRLLVNAPCHIGQDFEVNYGEMRFTGRIGDDGAYIEYIPSLMETAQVSINFPDGHTISETETIPDASLYRRVALVGEGLNDFQLHAWSNGANYGDVGHVYMNSPGNIGAVEGHMMVLGDKNFPSSNVAQVFSAPIINDLIESYPLITIEAFVNEMNCGKRYTILTITSDAGVVNNTPITMTMPGCEAMGELIILPLEFDHLKGLKKASYNN